MQKCTRFPTIHFPHFAPSTCEKVGAMSRKVAFPLQTDGYSSVDGWPSVLCTNGHSSPLRWPSDYRQMAIGLQMVSALVPNHALFSLSRGGFRA